MERKCVDDFGTSFWNQLIICWILLREIATHSVIKLSSSSLCLHPQGEFCAWYMKFLFGGKSPMEQHLSLLLEPVCWLELNVFNG
jgi:hypothetical protein